MALINSVTSMPHFVQTSVWYFNSKSFFFMVLSLEHFYWNELLLKIKARRLYEQDYQTKNVYFYVFRFWWVRWTLWEVIDLVVTGRGTGTRTSSIPITTTRLSNVMFPRSIRNFIYTFLIFRLHTKNEFGGTAPRARWVHFWFFSVLAVILLLKILEKIWAKKKIVLVIFENRWNISYINPW